MTPDPATITPPTSARFASLKARHQHANAGQVAAVAARRVAEVQPSSPTVVVAAFQSSI